MQAASRRNGASGFTLIDVLASVLAAAVLALTAGLMLFHAYDAWDENHDAVNLHREGRHAMDMIARAIRDASASRVQTAVNNNLVIENAAGTGAVQFRRVRRDLIYDPDTSVGGNDIVLVDDAVRRFRVNGRASTISIRLDLERGEESIRLDSTTAFRN